MALAGDSIIAVRSQIPDLPPALPIPASAAAPIVVAGSTLPPGIYNLFITQRNPWGETLAGPEILGVNVPVGDGIQITSALLPTATAIRAYLTLPGGAAGSEIQFVESNVSPFTISIPVTAAGTPPFRSTAYMPDSDGGTFGASTVFNWLNEGLKRLSRITGGLLDYAGVPTQAGNPLYSLPGEWLEITDVWYSGYWIQGGKRQDFFRRNTVTSQVLSGVAVSIFTDRQVLEVSYQPDRSAGVTATNAPMTATSTSVGIANTGAFLLPFGFAQIGTEMVAYSSLAGGQMAGLIRGVGSSSVPQAWPSGTVVTELPLFFCGKRIFNVAYQPGQSSVKLTVPQGWENILTRYMLAQAREAEQDGQNASRLLKEFEEEGQKWLLSNKGVVKQVQVGEYNRTVVYSSTVAGGLVLPS